MPICTGSLTSLLYIDSCWVYLILRSLTSLLYVVHVCRWSLTSPLMYCILCFMWVRVLSSLLHIMRVCRGANFPSLFFMNLYHTYNFNVLICFRPFVDELTKRGRSILRVYICMFCFSLYMHVLFSCSCKKGRRFWWVYFVVYAYIFLFSLYTLLNIYLFIAMHELRGSFY